jgi:hypothetical protein
MLYILRLTNGDCVIAMAADERSAREAAAKLSLDEAAQVATVRRLDAFGVQLYPTEDGSLEVGHWDDATLDGILAHEYPLLNQAYRRAIAEPFVETPSPQEPVLSLLRAAIERNTDIIRQGLRQELQRSIPAEVSTKSKAATARR